MGRKREMIELLRTNDAVQISFLTAILADAGIEALVFDNHTSIVEGSIGAIPRRLMVADDAAKFARELIAGVEGVGEIAASDK